MPSPNDIKVVSAADLKPEQVGHFLDEVVDAEGRTWPPELQATRAKFESRFRVFPQGFIAFRVNDKIEAVTTSQIVNYDPLDTSPKTWDQITDNGMITGTHLPSGNALYVVSVGVTADAGGQGLGGKLVEEQKNLAKKLGLQYLYLGARTPGYAEYIEKHGEISVDNYLAVKREDGQTEDQEIRFYERQGLKPARVIPDFEPDEASKNYGVVMVWQVE